MILVFQQQMSLALHLPPLPRPRMAMAMPDRPLVVPDAGPAPTPPAMAALPPVPPVNALPPAIRPSVPLLPAPAAPLPPMPAVPTPKPLAKLPDVEDIPVSGEFGESDGKGAAMHSVAGEQPMLAHKGPQDQPSISRDDPGQGDRNNKPSEDGGKPGEPGKPSPAAKVAQAPGQTTPPPVFGVVPPEQELTHPALPRHRQQEPAAAIGAGPLVRPADDTLPGTTQPSREKLAMLTPSHLPVTVEPAIKNPELAAKPSGPATRPAVPGERIAKAGANGEGGTADKTSKSTAPDPAPKTDSESDPFSMTGSAVFRAGRVDARFGRKVKTVRPRLELAGQYDLLSLPSPSVIMKVRADESGRVRNVEIVKSSGSSEVDQPCQLAMYEWWFEPPKDKAGKPQPAEMTWTISWHR